MLKTLNNKKETLLYIAIWVLLFLSPVASLYFHSVADGGDGGIKWGDVASVWYVFAIYLVIFLIHNFILAPQLIYRRRRLTYLATTICLIAVFCLWQCLNRPTDDGHKPPRTETQPPKTGAKPPKDMGQRPPFGHMGNGDRPPAKPDSRRPQPFIGQTDIIGLLILVGLLGLNLGIKLYFKSEHDQKEMAELERKDLKQQLQYLKYQINPHFFMNTLNNIHALVDIDPERAKAAIVELSKMMRYVLYEGDKSLIPLEKEVDFLHNYIHLMMLRYTDSVSVDLDIPDNLPGGQIPPLLLITFVENAFKHGVSYEHDSFVNISMDVEDGRLLFNCINSKAEAAKDNMPKEGGVGLRNVRQRLMLIYKDDYKLDINDGGTSYKVSLSLPINHTI